MSDVPPTQTALETEARKLGELVGGYWDAICEEFRVSEEATDWANPVPKAPGARKDEGR